MAKWRKADTLFRGDSPDGLAIPTPSSTCSIVEHVLYLGGTGRSTPYHSATENEEIASHFAGKDGRVYRTTVRAAEARAVHHIGQVELLGLLRGKGKGRAKWKSALEVMQARRYVEQWAEHLLDFRDVAANSVKTVVQELYAP